MDVTNVLNEVALCRTCTHLSYSVDNNHIVE